jgi:hypothetical protein
MNWTARTPELLERDAPRVAEILRRVEIRQPLSGEDAELIEATFAAYFQLAQWAQEDPMTVARLRALALGTASASPREECDEPHGENHAAEAS